MPNNRLTRQCLEALVRMDQTPDNIQSYNWISQIHDLEDLVYVLI